MVENYEMTRILPNCVKNVFFFIILRSFVFLWFLNILKTGQKICDGSCLLFRIFTIQKQGKSFFFEFVE
jgi:hypothetical protein